jgi:hypothetical protein
MNKLIRSLLQIVCAVAVSATVRAATVAPNPQNFTLNFGQTTSLQIIGRNFTGLPSGFLDGGGINFFFDSSVVHVTSVSIAPFWDPAFSVPTWSIDNVQGYVGPINFGTAGTGASGNFDIVTLGLQAVGPGTTGLTLTENLDNPFGSGGVPVPVTFETGMITVVPEPSSAMLVLVSFLVSSFYKMSFRQEKARTRTPV